MAEPEWFSQPNVGQARGPIIMEAARFLRDWGVEAPSREARLILGIVLGLDQATLFGHPEVLVAPAALQTFVTLLRRRAAGEPLSRLRGEREFWSLPFKINENTLDPRPDSECLIDAVLHHCPRREHAWRVLDLGTGTGCLVLAVLSEYPQAQGVGVDISPAALDVAASNAQVLGCSQRVQWRCSDWAQDLQGAYDIILSNPPYIPSHDIDQLDPAVRHYDPRLALDGGDDGLNCFRRLSEAIKTHLTEQGLAFIEHGDGQSKAVQAIFERVGLATLAQFSDGGERLRGVVLHHSHVNRTA